MFSLVVTLSFAAMHFNFTSLFKIGSYAVTPNDFLFLFAGLIFLYDVYLGNTKLRFRKNIVIVPFLIFLFFATISGLQPIFGEGGKNVLQFIKTWAHLIEMSSMFFMAFFYDDSVAKIKGLMKWWLIVGLISNIYALYSLVARPLGWPGAYIFFDVISDGGRGTINEGTGQIVLRYGDFFRATSFFSEPSSLAGFNNLTLLFFLIPKLMGQDYAFNNRFFNTIFILTWIPSQLFTFSLTAVLLLVVSGIAFLFIQGLHFTKKLLPYIIVFICLAVLSDQIQSIFTGTSVIELLLQRIGSIIFYDPNNFVSGESAYQRFLSYNIAWDIWEKYPYVGTGLGLTYTNGIYPVIFMEMSVMAALVETGILGMVFFTLSLILLSFTMLRRSKYLAKYMPSSHPEWFIPIYIVFTILCIGTTVSNMATTNGLTSMTLWIILSLIILVFQAERKFADKEYYTIGTAKTIKHKILDNIQNTY